MKGAVASPQVRDGTLYMATREGTVKAINLTTREPQWQHQTGNDILCTPRLSQDGLYVATVPGNVYRLDVKTGREDWMTKLKPALRTRPLVTSSGLCIAHNATGTITQLLLKDGTTRWNHSQEAGCNTPVRANGRIYTTNSNGNLESYKPDDGTRKRVHEPDAALVTAPAIGGNTAFVGTSTNAIVEISLSTGKELTSYSLESVPQAPPAVTSDHIIVATGDAATVEAFERTA